MTLARARGRLAARRRLAGALGLALAGAGAAASGLLLAGGSPAPDAADPRPVSAAQADRLAVMRFNNYRAAGAHFRTRVSSARGPLRLVGDVDFRRQVGYAAISGAGSSFTLQWSASTLLAWPSAGTPGPPPAKLPARAPARRALAPQQSLVDAVLALLVGLGGDRPDNAQLIRRNGAQWLRHDRVGATPVDVMRGPSASGAAPGSRGPLTYWLDRTGHLLRVDALFGGGPSVTRIDLDAASFATFARSGRLRGE